MVYGDSMKNKKIFSCSLPGTNSLQFVLGTIPFGNFELAIWDTSYWNFLLSNSDSKRALRHILGPSLINFEICKFFLQVQGYLSNFPKMDAFRKSFFNEGATSFQYI